METLTVRYLGNDATNSVNIKGVFYRFNNYICDIPQVLAMELVQKSNDYILEGFSGGADRGDKISFNADTWTTDYKKLVMNIPLGFANGYGKAAQMFATGLIRNGVDVQLTKGDWPTNTYDHLPKEIQAAIDKGVDRLDSYYMSLFPASAFTNSAIERFVGYSMLEASHIPLSWVNNINKNCERVIVPCEHNKGAFLDSGVKKDVYVVPLGLDLDLFPERPKGLNEDSDDIVFGIMGGLTHRKGPDLLVKAFKIAFADKPDAKLYIKTHPMSGITVNTYLTTDDIKGKNDQIYFVTDFFTPSELITEFFHKIDCFVFPTRGEGFGLPPIEAMALGLPVICTNYSGPADFMHEDYSYPLSYKEVPMPAPGQGYHDELRHPAQTWAEPDLDHLIALMLEVYNDKKRAAEKGRKAAEFVRKEFDCKNTTMKLIRHLTRKV